MKDICFHYLQEYNFRKSELPLADKCKSSYLQGPRCILQIEGAKACIKPNHGRFLHVFKSFWKSLEGGQSFKVLKGGPLA